MHRWGTVAHGNTGEAVSELLKAAERGDLATLKRLFADKAALAEGEEIAERDQYGRTPLLRAASYGRITVVEWLLTDGRSTMSEADHNGDMVWSHLKRHIRRAADVTLSSLLRHMVLLEDAPPAFLLFLVLEPQHKQIIFEGRQLRAQLLDHLEHLRTMLMRRCPLPSVLQPLIAAYAAPTTEDMWTIWWASTDFKVNVVQSKRLAGRLRAFLVGR
jgi:hypothetical protein